MTVKRTWTMLPALAVALYAASALAAEPERVVVRNRLYNPQGQMEIGVQAGMSLVNKLVSHDNFQLAAAYNFTNEWAVEAFGGYAVSSHTDVADQANSSVAGYSPTSLQVVDDFAGLWQLQWNVAAGARWAPIYGKLNLFADLPVHFQAYLALGAGVAGMERTSVTYCLSPAIEDQNAIPSGKRCDDPLVEKRTAPLAQFGGGLKFFMGPHAALRLEARDYAFPDKFQININRAQAATGDPAAGEPVSSPGFEHIIFLSAGVSYIF